MGAACGCWSRCCGNVRSRDGDAAHPDAAAVQRSERSGADRFAVWAAAQGPTRRPSRRRAARAGASGDQCFRADPAADRLDHHFISVEIARQFSNEILRGEAGEGSLVVDGAEIRYRRNADFLKITVTDGHGGETEVRVPLAFAAVPGFDDTLSEMPR